MKLIYKKIVINSNITTNNYILIFLLKMFLKFILKKNFTFYFFKFVGKYELLIILISFNLIYI